MSQQQAAANEHPLGGLLEEYPEGQYVLVFDTGDGMTLSDHYASRAEVSRGDDLELLAHYLVDRADREPVSLETLLHRLVDEVNDRRASR